jgi:hypothetical protein
VPGSTPGLNCKSRFPDVPVTAEVLMVIRYNSGFARADPAEEIPITVNNVTV